MAEKLRAAGLEYEGTELEELTRSKASDGDIQERLLQLESTVHVLNQELSRLRLGGANYRDRSSSISLDVSNRALAGEEPKVSLSSSPPPWKKSLQRLDDGVGVRGARDESSQSTLRDDGADDEFRPSREVVASSKKVQRDSNVLKAAHFFESGQDEPDASTVHRSILIEMHKIPQIKAMPRKHVEDAVRASVRFEGSPQQILMKKGDSDTFMIFTVIGSLCVKINDDSQASEISSGSLVGSHAFLYKRPRSATVSCIGHCVFYRIDMDQPGFGSATTTQFNSFQPDLAAGLPPSAGHGIKHASDTMKVAGRGTKPTGSTEEVTILSSSPTQSHDRDSLIAPNTSLGLC